MHPCMTEWHSSNDILECSFHLGHILHHVILEAWIGEDAHLLIVHAGSCLQVEAPLHGEPEHAHHCKVLACCSSKESAQSASVITYSRQPSYLQFTAM